MNKVTIEGSREGTRCIAKDQRGRRSNDRLDVIAAKRDQLEGEIQQAYTIIKDAAEQQNSFHAVERGLQRLFSQKVLH